LLNGGMHTLMLQLHSTEGSMVGYSHVQMLSVNLDAEQGISLCLAI